MIAVIVAGGKGTRLKPITNKIPKPMVKVGDKPILEHILNLFKKQGFTDFVFALCYKPEIITNYFGNGQKFGVNINYTYEKEDQPLGTAGAILPSKKYIKGAFIVTYADILRQLDIKEMIKSGKTIKDSEVLILGITFKENCPDMRNTKVVDIIEELKDFDVKVDVYDPWVDHESEDLQCKYGLVSDPFKSDKKYDAVVIAVGHEQFTEYSLRKFQNICNGDVITIDVKNIFKDSTWSL